MHTNMWIVDNVVERKILSTVTKAAKLLRENEAIAFPTETVYGLGANAMNDEAIAKILRRKEDRVIIHLLSTSVQNRS